MKSANCSGLTQGYKNKEATDTGHAQISESTVILITRHRYRAAREGVIASNEDGRSSLPYTISLIHLPALASFFESRDIYPTLKRLKRCERSSKPSLFFLTLLCAAELTNPNHRCNEQLRGGPRNGAPGYSANCV